MRQESTSGFGGIDAGALGERLDQAQRRAEERQEGLQRRRTKIALGVGLSLALVGTLLAIYFLKPFFLLRSLMTPGARAAFEELTWGDRIDFSKQSASHLDALVTAGWGVSITEVGAGGETSFDLELDEGRSILRECVLTRFGAADRMGCRCRSVERGPSTLGGIEGRAGLLVDVVVPSLDQLHAQLESGDLVSERARGQAVQDLAALSFFEISEIATRFDPALRELLAGEWGVAITGLTTATKGTGLELELEAEGSRLLGCGLWDIVTRQGLQCSAIFFLPEGDIGLGRAHDLSVRVPELGQRFGRAEDAPLLTSWMTSRAAKDFERMDFPAQIDWVARHLDLANDLEVGGWTEISGIAGRGVTIQQVTDDQPIFDLVYEPGKAILRECSMDASGMGGRCRRFESIRLGFLDWTTAAAHEFEVEIPRFDRLEAWPVNEDAFVERMAGEALESYWEFDLLDRYRAMEKAEPLLRALEEGGWDSTITDWVRTSADVAPVLQIAAFESRLFECQALDFAPRSGLSCVGMRWVRNGQPVTYQLPIRVPDLRLKDARSDWEEDLSSRMTALALADFETLDFPFQIDLVARHRPVLEELSASGWAPKVTRLVQTAESVEPVLQLAAFESCLVDCSTQDLDTRPGLQCAGIHYVWDGKQRKHQLPILVPNPGEKWARAQEEGLVTAFMSDISLEQFQALDFPSQIDFVARYQPRFQELAIGGWSTSITELADTQEGAKALLEAGLRGTTLHRCRLEGDLLGPAQAICQGFTHPVAAAADQASSRRRQAVQMVIPELDKPFATSGEETEIRLSSDGSSKALGIVHLTRDDLQVIEASLVVPSSVPSLWVPKTLAAANFSLQNAREVVATENWPVRWSVEVPEWARGILDDRRELEVLALDAKVKVKLADSRRGVLLAGRAAVLEAGAVELTIEYFGDQASLVIHHLSLPTPIPGMCLNFDRSVVEIDFTKKSLRVIGAIRLGSRESMQCKGAFNFAKLNPVMSKLVDMGLSRLWEWISLERAKDGLVVAQGHFLFDLSEYLICGKLAIDHESIVQASYHGSTGSFLVEAPFRWHREGFSLGDFPSLLWAFSQSEYHYPQSDARSCWSGDPGAFSETFQGLGGGDLTSRRAAGFRPGSG